MKGYGERGYMNPQTAQKSKMSNSSSKSKGSDMKSGVRDMSPPVKETNEQPIWQNMR